MMRSILFISLMLLLTSCGKDSFSITIHSPKNGTVYQQGAVIDIDYTVMDDIDITTIAYDSKDLGTGSVTASLLLGDQTVYSGTFSIKADVMPGEHTIWINATDENLNHAIQESVSIIIE